MSFSSFHQSVATLREEEQNESSGKRRRSIHDIRYDYVNKPIEGTDDGNWSLNNPVDATTGLWYDPQSGRDGADWADLVPAFLRHGYRGNLGLQDETSNPLLLIERSYNPPPVRQQMLEILMEECEVPATFFGKDATMACYACGRTTSTVIDIGHSGTTITPVFDGYVEQKGILRSPIGTKAMDDLALSHLEKVCKLQHPKKRLLPLYQVRNPKLQSRDTSFHRYALLQIARECREIGAGQSINTAASKTIQVPSISYALPDGNNVDVPSQSRFETANFVLKGGEEDAVAGLRNNVFTTVKEELQSMLETVKEDGEDEDMGAAGESAKKYTESTAVGVSSRRTTRGANPSSTPKKSAKADSKPDSAAFDNLQLQQACAPYLQTLSEQLTASPIANMVCDSSFRCDRDQQAGLLGNVVLTGGGGAIGPTDQAVTEVLREQIEAIIHAHTPGWRVKLLAPSIQERPICNWLGGSILASLGSFHEMWITKEEYEEWGPAIVNRKCP